MRLQRIGQFITSATLAALLFASPAAARRTVIDQGQFIDIGSPTDPCTIGGAPCTATILPFSFDFGSGLTDQAYIYDSGIISFGQEIVGVDPTTDFTTWGFDVIAPLYVPGVAGVAGPYETFAGSIGPSEFPETLPNFGTDLFVISFLDPSLKDPNSFLSPYVHVLIDASSGELRFEFIHGQSFLSQGNLQLALPNTTGTQLGFSLGNQQVLNDPPDIAGVNAFSFVSAAPVPEPSTWAMMLLGFAALGFMLRRDKRAEQHLQGA